MPLFSTKLNAIAVATAIACAVAHDAVFTEEKTMIPALPAA